MLRSSLDWKARLAFFTLFVCLCDFSRPGRAEDRLSVGMQLFSSGQLVEARRFFKAYSQEDPENPITAFYLGRIAFEDRRYEDAIENLEKAVQLDERSSDYHLWLGRAYGYQAQRSAVIVQPFLALEVKEHFEKVVELDPNNLDARADLQEYYGKAPGFLGGSRKKTKAQGEEIEKRKQQAQW